VKYSRITVPRITISGYIINTIYEVSTGEMLLVLTNEKAGSAEKIITFWGIERSKLKFFYKVSRK